MAKNSKHRLIDRQQYDILVKNNDILRKGITNMIAYARVLHEVLEKMRFYKQLNADIEKEFQTILGAIQIIAEEYFELKKPVIEDIWRSINSEWVEKTAKGIFSTITSKVIMPGDKDFGVKIKPYS